MLPLGLLEIKETVKMAQQKKRKASGLCFRCGVELENLRDRKEALLGKATPSAQDLAEVEQIDDRLRQEQPVNPAEARYLDILRRAAKEVEAQRRGTKPRNILKQSVKHVKHSETK